MADLVALKAEIDTDPLTRGYAAMTDAQVAADLNSSYRERNRDSMSASEVLNAIDIAEFNALTNAAESQIWNVLHLGGQSGPGGGSIDPFGIEATIFTNVFGAGSATIAALSAARKESITRGVELGLGLVKPGHVEQARAI